jgi:hypothetical protein
MKDKDRDALNLAVPPYDPPPGLEDRIMAAVAHKPRVKRSPLVVPLLSAAAAALAVGNLVQWGLPHTEPARAVPTVQPAAAAGAPKPGLEVVMLNGSDKAPKAFGTIVLDPDDNHGILAVRDLPPSSGRYELWLRTDTDKLSAGVFEVNDDGYGALMLKIPDNFKDFHEFRLCPAGSKTVVMTGRL